MPALRSLTNFIKYWNGKSPTGYTRPGGQCIDLVRYWLKKHTGDPYTIPRVFAAKEMYAAASPRKWRKTRWKFGKVPPAGAIVVFDDHPGNQWGHVAIARAGSTKHELLSFDANWNTYRVASRETHRYARDRVVGWLLWRR